MKQIHVYELEDEEIKSIDKIMREERKIGFELERILNTIGSPNTFNYRPYTVTFTLKPKAEKKNAKTN